MIRSVRTIARVSLEAGLVAGVTMMPFGAALRALGYQVNVYGELMVRALLGSAPMLAQLVLHVVVSITLAIPFVLFARWRGGANHIPGAVYGLLAWAAMNATLLPLLFERSTGWALGFRVVWPSLLVHLVYGASLGAVTARRMSRVRAVAEHRAS